MDDGLFGQEKRPSTGDADQDSSWDETADYIIAMARESIRQEVDRGNTLNSYAGHLLTATSILSIAVVTLAPPLLESSNGGKRLFFLMMLILLAILFLLSALFALLALHREKGKYLADPLTLCKVIANPFESE